MKKRFLLALGMIMLILSGTASAQWTGHSSTGDLANDIHRQGNVGIGTSAAPAEKLEVNGRILSQMTNQGGFDYALGAGSGNGLVVGKLNGNTNVASDLSHLLYRNGLGAIYYGYNGTGIQTTAINSQTGGHSYFNSGGNLAIGTNIAQSKVHIYSLSSQIIRFERPASNVFGFEMGGSSFGLYDYTTAGYKWRTDAGNLYLAESGGSVSIGTTQHDATLTVKGDIHAQEVRIDVDFDDVPDYVLEEKYDLSTLAEVEAYIKENQHLPEVPSAKEMEANGLNLKEMNLLLLKKVEELTLHLIDANKKIESLDQEVQSLKKSGTR